MRRYRREEGGDLWDTVDRMWWVPMEDRLTVELCHIAGGGERRVIRKEEIEELSDAAAQ